MTEPPEIKPGELVRGKTDIHDPGCNCERCRVPVLSAPINAHGYVKIGTFGPGNPSRIAAYAAMLHSDVRTISQWMRDVERYKKALEEITRSPAAAFDKGHSSVVAKIARDALEDPESR
jgi:hypothetical protein